jgi:hypothetical protein
MMKTRESMPKDLNSAMTTWEKTAYCLANWWIDYTWGYRGIVDDYLCTGSMVWASQDRERNEGKEV